MDTRVQRRRKRDEDHRRDRRQPGRARHYTSAGAWSARQVGDRNTLTELRDGANKRTGFQYKLWADDSVEHYDAGGRLLRIVQRNGWTTTSTYSDATTPPTVAPFAGLLISVRNHFGRELRLTYDAGGRLVELLRPGAVSGTAPGSAASPIRYVHDEPESRGSGVPALNQLTSVVWQDGHRRRRGSAPLNTNLAAITGSAAGIGGIGCWALCRGQGRAPGEANP
jgi:YD repeat-containing protein